MDIFVVQDKTFIHRCISDKDYCTAETINMLLGLFDKQSLEKLLQIKDPLHNNETIDNLLTAGNSRNNIIKRRILEKKQE